MPKLSPKTVAKRKIEAKVDAIFKAPNYYSVGVENHRVGGFSVVFRGHELSFDDLKLLSTTFGTNNINVGSEDRDDGDCDTCSSPYSVNVVRMDGIGAEWQ